MSGDKFHGYHVGQRIWVRVTNSRLPNQPAVVTDVTEHEVSYRYAEDSQWMPGVNGTIRLSRFQPRLRVEDRRKHD